jgi:GAF domain-containing protein
MGTVRGVQNRAASRSDVGKGLRSSDEAALRRRIKLEALVASISRQLLGASAEALDDEIPWALREIGLFAHAERSFLYRCERDLEIWENTHEWHAPAISSLQPGARYVQLSNYPWSFRMLQLGQVVRFNAHDLPPEASGERDWLHHGGMGAALILPLTVRGQLVGCLGLNTTRSDEQWQEEDLDCLRTASEIILQALDRQRAERHQARQADRLNAQNAVLEMIARGRPLTEVLTALARLVEDQGPACAAML